MDIVSMLVSEDLDFNVTWSLYVLFHEHMVISETLHTFSLSGFKLVHELSFLHDDTHALATTP